MRRRNTLFSSLDDVCLPSSRAATSLRVLSHCKQPTGEFDFPQVTIYTANMDLHFVLLLFCIKPEKTWHLHCVTLQRAESQSHSPNMERCPEQKKETTVHRKLHPSHHLSRTCSTQRSLTGTSVCMHRYNHPPHLPKAAPE